MWLACSKMSALRDSSAIVVREFSSLERSTTRRGAARVEHVFAAEKHEMLLVIRTHRPPQAYLKLSTFLRLDVLRRSIRYEQVSHDPAVDDVDQLTHLPQIVISSVLHPLS